jgi:hypothetical protein
VATDVPSSGSDTVEAREAAWLCVSADALPSLLTADGGPWDIIQAFWRRTPATQKTEIFVMCRQLDDERAANVRIRPGYEITLDLRWPLRQTGTPLAETEQQNYKTACDLLLQRIRGPVGNKTHGGRFLSAGEVPRLPGVRIAHEDPRVTIPDGKELRGTVTYHADDFEING